MKKISLYIIAVLMCCACGTTVPPTNDSNSSTTVEITYNGSAVDIVNPLSDKGVSITANGANVTVTSTSTIENIQYYISGNTTDGNLKIYSDIKLQLVLNNIDITSTNGPAINIQSKKNIGVVLAQGTTNTLTDCNVYDTDTTEDARGTFFSEGQLVFSGEGSLQVNGHYKHAIASDDFIEIAGGNISITCDSSDGFHTNDYFICTGGIINVTCTGTGGDGIDCAKGYIQIDGGDITINTVDKGIATSLDTVAEPTLAGLGLQPYIIINGGNISITTTGERAHGIDAATDITINGGVITIVAGGYKSDGLNCSQTITANGGVVSVTANDDCYKSTWFVGNTGLISCN